MATKKRQVIRLLLFIGMVLCFSLQSMTSFKKFLSEKTSLTESYVKKRPEPLPSFSICSEPPFNHEYLKFKNMSPTFFLSSYQLRLLQALIWSIVKYLHNSIFHNKNVFQHIHLQFYFTVFYIQKALTINSNNKIIITRTINKLVLLYYLILDLLYT